jgi:hypothetical protein
MKKLIPLTLMLLFSLFMTAQDSKIVLGMLPFHSKLLGENAYTRQISELVTTAFVGTGRFSLFDEERLQQLLLDNKLSSKSLDDMNAAGFSKIGEAAGIRYIVAGDLKLLETKPATDITGKPAWTAHVIFTVQYIDVSSGAIGNIKSFDSYNGTGGLVNLSYDSEANAVIKTIQLAKKPMEKFIHDNFPVIFSLTGIMEEKNNEALKVEILGGKNAGLEKNDKLTVFSIEIRTINGNNYRKRKEIGSVKITEVQGDQLSEAKVLAGGEEILKQFKQDPAYLECETQ